MKQQLNALIATAVAAFLVTACSKAPNSRNEIEVVAMLPLTGDLAFLGDPGKAALKIADTDLAAAGKPFRYKTVDTKANPKETVTLMRREKDVNGRNIFLVTLSGPSMAARESFANDDVAIIAVAIHPDLPAAGAPIVRFCLSARQEGEMLAERIGKSDRPIGLILSRDAATTNEAEKTIIPALKSRNKSIAFTEWFDVSNKDFSNLRARFQETKPPEILLLGYGSDFPAALEAIALTGATSGLTIYGGIGFVEMEKRPSGFDDAEFQVVVPAFSIGTDNPAAEQFRQKYKAATGKSAPYDAAFTYDAAITLGDLFANGVTGPKEIVSRLRGSAFQGVTGKIQIHQTGEAVTDLRWATFGTEKLAELQK